jgi:hypothetical protein
MSAVDFVLYCAGIGILLLSGGVTVRLSRGDKKSTAPPAPPSPPAEELPANDLGLTDRLRAFQEQRFAAPILYRRQVEHEYAPGPGEPGGRRVVPPPRRQPARPFSTPKQPKRESNVVPFPQKQAKPEDDPNKKD